MSNKPLKKYFLLLFALVSIQDDYFKGKHSFYQ